MTRYKVTIYSLHRDLPPEVVTNVSRVFVTSTGALLELYGPGPGGRSRHFGSWPTVNLRKWIQEEM